MAMESLEGLGWISILEIDYNPRVLYVSDSLEFILGWKPEEMVGNRIIDYLHPHERELSKALVIHAITHDSIASLTYLTMLKKNGDPILVVSSYNIVYDRVVCSGSVAVPGQKARLRSLTASETVPVSRLPPGRYAPMPRWGRPQTQPLQVAMALVANPPPLPTMSKRTCVFVNRFTKECTIIHVTNNLFLDVGEVYDRPFFQYVHPEDEGEVRYRVDAAKAWNRHGDSNTDGGFEYSTFRLLPHGRVAVVNPPPPRRKKRVRSLSPSPEPRQTKPAATKVESPPPRQLSPSTSSSSRKDTSSPEDARAKTAAAVAESPAEGSGSGPKRSAEGEVPEWLLVDAVFTACSDGLLIIIREAEGEVDV